MIIQTANPTKQNYVPEGKPERGGQNVPPFGNVQAATVYNFKGLLEICRYSNQPAANAVIDFLWDVADDIRKHGMYLSDKAVNAYQGCETVSHQV